MAGKPQWSKEAAITEALAWCKRNERWPRASAGPFSEGVGTRLWGSWNATLTAIRKAYHDKYGVPVWDERRPRLGTFRQQLMADTLDIIEGGLAGLKSLKPHKPLSPKRDTEKDPSELHLLVSDVHVGEYNDPALMSGLAGPDGYSFEIFNTYADKLEERVLFFKKLYSRAWTIDKLVVNMLGDLVSGESIFLGQALQIDRILTDQVFEAAHRFACMVNNWAKHFEQVEIYCIPGNHGRIGKKSELHWRSNMDYVAYRVMATLLRDNERVRFIIAEGPYLIVEHGDAWRFLLHHGDSIMGGGVTKGNLVSLERKIHQVGQMADLTIHYSCSGHFHRSASLAMAGGGRIIANGSFPGGSPFSITILGDSQIPSQKLLLFSPSRGVHSETDIQLAEKQMLIKDGNRVYTGNYRETG